MSKVQKKQVFSISQKYNEVFSILDSVDNKSEFICQAIMEKANGIENISDSKLESKMRKILKNLLIEENLFLVSGDVKALNVVPKSQTSIPTSNFEDDDEDDDEYLKSVLKNM